MEIILKDFVLCNIVLFNIKKIRIILILCFFTSSLNKIIFIK